MHIYEKSRVKAMQDMLGKKMIHARFEYTDGIKRLVRSALLPLLLSRSADESLSILDCGCGVGPWLEFIAGLAPACHQDRLYGFDLTPELVELARQRLADLQTDHADIPRRHSKSRVVSVLRWPDKLRHHLHLQCYSTTPPQAPTHRIPANVGTSISQRCRCCR